MDDKGAERLTKKKDYEYDKKIRELYRSDRNNTDSYSEFKEKMRKVKNKF